ncbi:hypothetical protein FUAX_42780 (plasmid) [Fulvitalea axinellae]|uniref:Uncharacterized protein n=1 Tax=Fulvitalea axinellae TaxID=1182444 RepID=A0AAU9DFD5_9BACT|nr:hypothetical protein FUAX_42780 [Fulvitalea axinellae]
MLQRKAAHDRIFNKKEVIQRAVGFEIEVDYNPIRNHAHEIERYEERIPCARSRFEPFHEREVLLKGKNFEMQTDVGATNKIAYVEFVTAPFEESPKGFHELQECFATLTALMRTLNQNARRVRPEGLPITKLAPFGTIVPGYEQTLFKFYRHWSNNIFNGNFHFTAGIRLDRIRRAFSDIAAPATDEDEETRLQKAGGRRHIMRIQDSRYGDQDEMYGEYTRSLLDQIEAMGQAIDLSPELEGLLLLIGFYIKFGAREIPKYLRSFSPMLSRTDFGSMFQSLDPELVESLSQNDAMEWHKIASILTSYLETNTKGLDSPLFPEGLYHEIKKFESRRFLMNDISIGKWMHGMAHGVDLLTLRDNPRAEELRLQLDTMGAMGSQMDTVGPQMQHKAPIIEFRNMGEPYGVSLWQSVAEHVFRWVYALNKDIDHTFMDIDNFSIPKWKPKEAPED